MAARKFSQSLKRSISLFIALALVFSCLTPALAAPTPIDSVEQALLDGGARLAAMQNTDGGWDWPLDNGNPATGSATNTVGPIGMGLAQSYVYTQDASLLAAVQKASAYLQSKTLFSPSDGYLAVELDAVLGGTANVDYVRANFYDKLAAGTYLRSGVEHTTASYINVIRTGRSGSQANMAAWDIGVGLHSAYAMGEDTAPWIAAVKAEIDELDTNNYYAVIGLAGAVFGLASAGVDYDPAAGSFISASSVVDLADILAGYQLSGGGFTWSPAYTDVTDQVVQETAYAVLALNKVDRTRYMVELQEAASFLKRVQLASGGWESYTDAGENNEITGEALWAISAAPHAVWVCPSGSCGHPGDEFNTIQAGIDAIPAGGTVYIFPGDYNETAAGSVMYNNIAYQFGLFIGQAKYGITLQGVNSEGDPITDPLLAEAVIKTNATNSFGYSGTFVEADNVTIAGLEFQENIPGNNKLFEIIGDGFSLLNSHINVPLATGYGAVYFGDSRYDAAAGTSHIKSYTLSGNLFSNGSIISINNGAGDSGPVSGRQIVNNTFDLAGAARSSITFSGNGTTVPWFTYPVGGAVIQGNTFENGTGAYIMVRGMADQAQFDWASYWDDNTYDQAFSVGPNPPADLRSYSYTSGSYVLNHVRRIGASIQAELDNLQPGDRLIAKPGFIITTPGMTIDGRGARIGPGSPAFTIAANDVTILNFIVDGTGADSSTPGILVAEGVERLYLHNLEILNWTGSGIQFDGAVTDLKLIDNYIHDNAGDGVTFAAAPSGFVQIYGNAFRSNGGFGINSTGAVAAEYNEWGSFDGPSGTDGDGASVDVDFTPYVFGSVYVQSPTPDTVREGETVSVDVLIDAQNLLGAQFTLAFTPAQLQVVSVVSTGTNIFQGASPCISAFDNVAGQVTFRCTREGLATGTALKLATITFQAQAIPGTSAVSQLNAGGVVLGSTDGINVFVDSVLSDSVTILGTTTLSGRVDLQGRGSEAGASVNPGAGAAHGMDPAPYTTGVWGTYVFTNLTDDSYTILIHKDGYLDATATVTVSGTTQALNSVILLGGDAVADNLIDLLDAGLVGGQFGFTSASGGWDARADINGDNVVSILDLVLVGSNFGLTSSPWSPQ